MAIAQEAYPSSPTTTSNGLQTYTLAEAQKIAAQYGGIIDYAGSSPGEDKWYVLDQGSPLKPQGWGGFLQTMLPMIPPGVFGKGESVTASPWMTPQGVGGIFPWQSQVQYPSGEYGRAEPSYSNTALAELNRIGYDTKGFETRSLSKGSMSYPELAQLVQDSIQAGEETNPTGIGDVNMNPAVNIEMTPMGNGYMLIKYLDKDGNVVSTEYNTDPMFQKANQAPTMYDPYGQNPYGWVDDPNTPYVEGWNPYTAEWLKPQGYIDPYQQSMLDYQQQQFAWQKQQDQQQLALQQQQLANQEKQYEANLRANPASWLEYAAYKGEAPVVQPWMLPLMPNQYGINSVGEALPTDYNNLPQLTSPSAQYMARIAPSSRQQFFGYEKARTGAMPEDTQWRMWARSAPGGSNTSLSYTR